MMALVARRKVKRQFTATPSLLFSGWIATVVMGAATLALIVQTARA